MTAGKKAAHSVGALIMRNAEYMAEAAQISTIYRAAGIARSTWYARKQKPEDLSLVEVMALATALNVSIEKLTRPLTWAAQED